MVLLAWERLYIREIASVFLLFLGTFYFLYVSIDYSSHSGTFSNSGMSYAQIGVYYLCHFVLRFDILVPLAVMLASMRTLCQMNVGNELVALLAGGIGRQRMARPFLLIGFATVAVIFLNYQYFLPSAISTLDQYGTKYLGRSGGVPANEGIHRLILKDHSHLFYHHYNSEMERFEDVYWIRSADDIVKMRVLYPHDTYSVGKVVDYLVRDEKGQMEVGDRSTEATFHEIGMQDDVIGTALVNAEELSLSELWKILPSVRHGGHWTDREAQVLTLFMFKTAMPLLGLLVIIGPMPFCLHFSRNLNIYYLYGGAIAGFLFFFTFLNASMTLGESQVISPALSIWGPVFLFSCPFLGLFFRMR